MEHLPARGLLAARDALEHGDLTSADLLDACLAQIARRADLNAFLALADAETLRAQARQVDALRRGGQALGPLAGLPVAIKDNIVTEGLTTTAGSRALASFEPPYDASAVSALKRAGALIVGKTNLDEFAMGSSGESSAFGPTLNPHDVARSPGGSSSGSAAAVAASLCLAALGSDTGGSVRQPAAFCGVVGFKPTYGRISRHGLIAYASSLDQIGTLTTSVADAAALLEILAGHDRRDMTSSKAHLGEVVAAARARAIAPGLRVGLPVEYRSEGLQPAIAEALVRAADTLADLGADIVEVSLPHTDYAVASYYLVATAEASSNLARYDGVRYGHRAEEPGDLRDLYERSRAEAFGPEVTRRILLGTFVLSAGYYDAYYTKAQQVRTLIRGDFTRAFEQVDVLLTPTTPQTAFALGERVDDPLAMYLSDIYTIACNLAGLPGISLPAGRDEMGLPIGIQLMAPAFDEVGLFTVAGALEAALAGGAS